jgi:hypothetical protein
MFFDPKFILDQKTTSVQQQQPQKTRFCGTKIDVFWSISRLARGAETRGQPWGSQHFQVFLVFSSRKPKL